MAKFGYEYSSSGSEDFLPKQADEKKRRVIMAAVIMIFLIVVGAITELISDVVLIDKIVAAFGDQIPEIKDAGSLSASSIFQKILNLGVALAIPITGIYGAMKSEKNLVGFFTAGSCCCCCCSFCSFLMIIVAAPLFFVAIASTSQFLDTCDAYKACPLSGTNAEVLDCLAASTWNSEYSRKYSYGQPLPDTCPDIWLNCTDVNVSYPKSTESFTQLFEVDRKPLSFDRPASRASSRLLTPLSRTAFRTLPRYVRVPLSVQTTPLLSQMLLTPKSAPSPGQKSLRLSVRRLETEAEKEFPSALEGIESERTQRMPIDPIASCTANKEVIEALPNLKTLFHEVLPTMQNFLIFGGVLSFLMVLAYASGTLFGKGLHDELSRF